MGSYVVLARKWRPAQFSDIVGQGAVVRTLMNAIRSQRIHQAYLFTGSRGIGKTSIARIFAKAIRCEAAELKNDWLSSCDQCSHCKEIALGNGMDVIEIDGASNNGVDAVREIRENAKYLPASGSRKIYIIDEVHMLTTAAFNALLKTLEEPPAHVIFIFATTEPHKIPATILSRCQRFDFRRVTSAQIQTRLAEVIRAEGVDSEPGALALIARSAEGSMRDALSLLDQVIAFAGPKLTLQAVRESVSLVEGETVLGILEGIFSKKPLKALALVEQAYSQGHDLRVLTRSLIEFLHGAILIKVGTSTPGALENISSEEWKELSTLADQRSIEEIELIFQVLHHGLEWIARSPQPKLVLDVLLVKCATAETLIYLDPKDSNNTPKTDPTPRTQGQPPEPSRRELNPAPTFSSHLAMAAQQAQATTLASGLAQISAPKISQPQTTTPHTAPTQAAVTLAPSAQPTQKSKDLLSWEGFIEHVRIPRPLLATLLEHGNALSFPDQKEDVLMIGFHPNDAYFKEQLQSRVYHEQLMTLSQEYFGRFIRVQLELKEEGESLAARKERVAHERARAAREAAQNHPIIREAKALFGGELGPIELTDVDT